MTGLEQRGLFPDEDTPDDVAVINGRCIVRTRDGHRVVVVSGVALAAYAIGDLTAQAYAMVSLVEQDHADQVDVARAFGCASRTVRRHQRRFEDDGLRALGRPAGYPKGRSRIPSTRRELVFRLKSEGVSNREIARQVGVDEKAIRKLARRLGFVEHHAEQAELPLAPAPADPNLSASAVIAQEPQPDAAPPGADPNLSASVVAAEGRSDAPATAADPNLSAPVTSDDVATTYDIDPANRSTDRLLAYLGLLDDAAPLFRQGTRVPGAGVLLALPAIEKSGVVEIARDVYGSIGPAFYGLRTTVVALVLLALLRIKRPEALKEHSPEDLGRILGLDRAPEVKTLRRKLARLAGLGLAVDFGRALAKRRVSERGASLGFLYVDGHVRVYHGKHRLPKAHVARMRIAMPATTDYWVNDAVGDPLFVVTAKANAGLAKMLTVVLDEVRGLVGDRRITIVFDRGGYSPKLFAKLIAAGFDVLTYQKGRTPKIQARFFEHHKGVVDGRNVEYMLADRDVVVGACKLHMRQVTRRTDDGHQTPILTSRRDLSVLEIAFRMFERWRQENFFKYLRDEYALDALVEHAVVDDDAARDVPNPVRAELDAKLKLARAELARLQADYGLRAFGNPESRRPTMRGFKIAHGPLRHAVRAAVKRVEDLEEKRAKVPARVPVRDVVDGDVVKLAPERQHLASLFKMVAYQAESDLVRQIAPHYKRVDDEGRTLIQSALADAADIEVVGDELHVRLAPLSSAHRTRAVAALCDELNGTGTRFPGTKLRVRYSIAAAPVA
ncbi:MAG TPA: hypothetical protein VJM14_15215 [Burkholderiales bacterium]|nr:hypothetical protein [Burkholderiales bacterium]